MKKLLLLILVIIIGHLGNCSSSPENNIVSKEIVYNGEMSGSVAQVEVYLERNLKDPSSYEPIQWGKVIKFDNSGVIEARKNKGKCKYYTDSQCKTEDGMSPLTNEDVDVATLYVIEKNNGIIKFHFSASFVDEKNGAQPDYWCQEKNTVLAPEKDQINTDIKYSVFHKYRAKNSFGGYEISEQTFSMDKNGNVINVE